MTLPENELILSVVMLAECVASTYNKENNWEQFDVVLSPWRDLHFPLAFNHQEDILACDRMQVKTRWMRFS